MGNPDTFILPPAPKEKPKHDQDLEKLRKESRDAVIPDLTDDAVLIEEGSDEVRENTREIMEIENQRIADENSKKDGTKEAQIAAKNAEYQRQIQADLDEEAIEDAKKKLADVTVAENDQEKTWFETGDNMAAKAEADARASAKEIKEYADRANRGVGEREKTRKMLSHEAGQFRAAGKKMTANEVGDQARNNAEVLAMVEKELKKDFGVDIVAMPTAGFWANARLNLRSAADGKLRAKLSEYRELMKISEASLDKMEGKG